MTARICWVLAAVLFVVSCIAYRKEHDVAGDRLLFLAYSALFFAWMLPIREWWPV